MKKSLQQIPGQCQRTTEQDCRKRARDAEWNFRVSKGYVKDTFWNRLWFRLTH